MQVTSLLSDQDPEHDHEHDHDHHHHDGHDHGHEHTPVRLKQTLLGVIFVVNAFVLDWVFDQASTAASASAMIGAIILGYPIVWTSIKTLRRGQLTINELVGIAVLAAFASGDYKTAGIVAFFMLTGEIIETRTAEGARQSIESLIKLTPRRPGASRPRARRKSRPRTSPSAMSSASGPGTTWRGRRDCFRPGFHQPGQHHRRIAAGG